MDKFTTEDALLLYRGLHDQYRRKNAAYGNSAHITFEAWGPTAYLVRISDKINRMNQLMAKPETDDIGEYKRISLGVSMELPEGYEAHVVPRSSTFERYGIIMANEVGIIDNSFCGPEDIWQFPALAMRDTRIEKGDRICQFRIMPAMGDVSIVTVDKLGGTNRGGFGSTGKR